MPGPVQFQLRTLLLLFVAIWSSMAAFGVAGIPITIIGLGVVTGYRVYRARGGMMTCGEIVLIVIVTLGLIGLMLPAVQSARESSRRAGCMNRMKQIGLALHYYHETQGVFPPAYVADADGMPMHSWRVLILPYLEEEDLYDAYDFDEPWDGPNNRKLAEFMPQLYQCPGSNPNDGRTNSNPNDGTTSYVAVVGPDTVWPGEESTSIADIRDGATNTILLVEADSDIPWMEPRDLSLEEALSDSSDSWRNRGSHRFKRGYFVIEEWRGGGNVVLVDGSTHYLGGPLLKTIRCWFEIDDRTPSAPLESFQSKARVDTGVWVESVWYIHWGHCIGLSIWILSMLVLLTRPLPSAWVMNELTDELTDESTDKEP